MAETTDTPVSCRFATVFAAEPSDGALNSPTTGLTMEWKRLLRLDRDRPLGARTGALKMWSRRVANAAAGSRRGNARWSLAPARLGSEVGVTSSPRGHRRWRASATSLRAIVHERCEATACHWCYAPLATAAPVVCRDCLQASFARRRAQLGERSHNPVWPFGTARRRGRRAVPCCARASAVHQACARRADGRKVSQRSRHGGAL